MKVLENRDCYQPSGNPNAARSNIAPSAASTKVTVAFSTLSKHSNENCCRICHGTNEEAELFSYCQCKGSVGLAHSSCLIFWIKKSGSVKCELCQERYSIVGKLNKAIWQWTIPRLGIIGWLKLFFFIGFLSLFISYTTWAILAIFYPIKEIKELEKRRENGAVWVAHVICTILLFIPCFAIGFANFSSFMIYVRKCIVKNQKIILIPKGELCKETLGTEIDKLNLFQIGGDCETGMKDSHCNTIPDSHLRVEDVTMHKNKFNSYVLFKSDIVSDITIV